MNITLHPILKFGMITALSTWYETIKKININEIAPVGFVKNLPEYFTLERVSIVLI